jgi:hypothetical protein
MGGEARIANPCEKIRRRSLTGSRAALSEEGIGRAAVRGGFIPVRLHPRDFCFEHPNPLSQFGLRIGAEVVACEASRRVSAGPRAIGFFHCDAASAPSGLLSIGETVIRLIKMDKQAVTGGA